MKTKILVSACLLGEAVRYDGKSKPSHKDKLQPLMDEERVVSICPEVMGGLLVPREKAEKFENKILTLSGRDLTAEFEKGARLVLEIAQRENIKVAILKEKSPSCGSKLIYDGSFQGNLVPGKGLTTLLLESEGIRVFGESEIQAALEYMDGLDA